MDVQEFIDKHKIMVSSNPADLSMLEIRLKLGFCYSIEKFKVLEKNDTIKPADFKKIIATALCKIRNILSQMKDDLELIKEAKDGEEKRIESGTAGQS